MATLTALEDAGPILPQVRCVLAAAISASIGEVPTILRRASHRHYQIAQRELKIATIMD